MVEMKPLIRGIVVVVIFVAFVEADRCGEEKLKECIDKYESEYSIESLQDEECPKRRGAVRCLADAADECKGDDTNPDIERASQRLNQWLSDECEGADKCLEYVMHVSLTERCSLTAILLEANNVMGSPEEFSMNELACTMHRLSVKCLQELATERCGEEGGQLMVEMLNDSMSEEVREQLEQCESNQERQSDSVDDFFSSAVDQSSPPVYRKRRGWSVRGGRPTYSWKN